MAGQPKSFKVAATLERYRIVGPNSGTADTVSYPENEAHAVFGVTLEEAIDATSCIPVAGPGEIAKVLFNQTVLAGGLVAGDASGRGVAPTVTTAGTYVIGHLIGPSVALTGSVLDVYINPHFQSIP